MESQTYDIEINNQTYNVRCSDGEHHIRKIEGRLRDAVAMIGQGANAQNLSPYALKIAITLADQGVQDSNQRDEQEALVARKLGPLIDRLDQLLGLPETDQPEVAVSAEVG